jgi:hypothetical protein
MALARHHRQPGLGEQPFQPRRALLLLLAISLARLQMTDRGCEKMDDRCRSSFRRLYRNLE